MEYKNNPYDLIHFINDATSPFHVVEKSISLLEEAGFEKIDVTKKWALKKGKSYYTAPYGSVLFAFTIPDDLENSNFRIAAAHTDHPCLRIKPIAEICEGDYLKVDTGIYGGPILNTWLDRPLSIAGKVSLKSDDIFHPGTKLVDFKRPILTIPNLAIHFDNTINKGVELNKQTDMLPLAGMMGENICKKDYFIKFLAKEIDADPEDILDFDLFIYNAEPGQIIGMNGDFISCPRLDNLTSVFSCINGIINSHRTTGINIIALFDNEEVGSLTKQGADSNLLTIILEKIYHSFAFEQSAFYESIMRSFLLSVDVGHCLHPNKPEKNDPVNKNVLNGGFVIKIDLNQKYAFDTEAIAVIQQICIANNIEYQKFINRSDIVGGSTLGAMVSSKLPMNTVDVGVPLLAMHSARELMGSKDQESLNSLIKAFFMA
ncbi:aspartyl aminopeptidase [Mobilisporobacter senegalensis]|uniref:M18 family aminopeptidase n=1 Tax=Mobilisporobacter senegalensis TaxID=1329262 RepID=A0A3N1XNE8_9FIRM|nr:M18 family aminopeptidase [Mobilisporobacter senegalensis]ROR28176.1 aspartyl aminopeptidase [Mobilisporobacter senegalensis]